MSGNGPNYLQWAHSILMALPTDSRLFDNSCYLLPLKFSNTLENISREPNTHKRMDKMEVWIQYCRHSAKVPFGASGGALSKKSATELGRIAIKAALASGNVDPSTVAMPFNFGNVIQTSPAAYLARHGRSCMNLSWRDPEDSFRSAEEIFWSD